MSGQTGTYGGRVDDAISQDLFPTGEPMGPGFGPYGAGGGAEQLKVAQASLEVVERHLEPLNTRQVGALMLLKQEGGPFGEMAQFYLENYHRRGGVTGLIDALAGLSLVRSFKGVNVMRTAGGSAQSGSGGWRR